MGRELHLNPPAGDEPHTHHSLQALLQLVPGRHLCEVGGQSGARLHHQFPVVHTLGHGQEEVRPDLEVVELPDGFLGVLRLAVSDVAVAPEVTISRTLLTGQLFLPVDSTELQHEPQLEDLAHGAEDWDQLVLEKQMNILFRAKAIQGEDLKAVSGQSVAVDL